MVAYYDDIRSLTPGEISQLIRQRERERWDNLRPAMDKIKADIQRNATWVTSLKPCPMCGRAPVLNVTCGPSKENKDILVMLSIECKHDSEWCNAGFGGRSCSFETYCGQSDVPDRIIENLKRAWNTRSSNQAKDAATGLKPCPFCGRQPVQIKSNNAWGMKPSIECHCVGIVSIHASSDAENVKLWNGRGEKKSFFSRLFD